MKSSPAAFYFQQRGTRLNLRELNGLDIDRVVKEVDVDALQNHLENITFCNLREEDLRFLSDPLVVKLFRVAQLLIEYLLYAQDQLATNLNDLAVKYSEKKRSLVLKRRELTELHESSRHLRAEVRSKKRSISTLEDLLKEAGSNRGREHKVNSVEREFSSKGNTTSVETRPSVLQFFVTGPGGLCVEFNERGSTTIQQLTKDVTQALVPRKAQRIDMTIKLVYQGRILQHDTTLDGCNVRVGDSLVAVVEGSGLDDELEELDESGEGEAKTGGIGFSAKMKRGSKKDSAFAAATAASAAAVESEWQGFLIRQKAEMAGMAAELRCVYLLFFFTCLFIFHPHPPFILYFREGWQSAIKAVVEVNRDRAQNETPALASFSSVEAELLQKMDSRYDRLEGSMRQQLDAQLRQYEAKLQVRSNSFKVL